MAFKPNSFGRSTRSRVSEAPPKPKFEPFFVDMNAPRTKAFASQLKLRQIILLSDGPARVTSELKPAQFSRYAIKLEGQDGKERVIPYDSPEEAEADEREVFPS